MAFDIGYWIEGSRSRTSPPTRLELSDFIMRRFISPPRLEPWPWAMVGTAAVTALLDSDESDLQPGCWGDQGAFSCTVGHAYWIFPGYISDSYCIFKVM